MKRIFISFIFVLITLILFCQENKTALIIGNSNYKQGILKNPENDAKAMADALKSLGFNVNIYVNVQSQNEMKRIVREFGDILKNKGGIGLFYFAGHGIQIKGLNYLIPINAVINSESDVEYESLDLGLVLGKMEDAGNKLNICILDACRDNPFSRSFRSGSERGLAVISKSPPSTIIAYATSPGSVASDGSDKNGLYTEELLKAIKKPNLKIEDVFKEVGKNVSDKTLGKQLPWVNSSFYGQFSFVTQKEEIKNKITLKLAETHPADFPTTLGDIEFSKLVEKKTGGTIKIQVYHSRQLGEEKDVIEKVQAGEIEFARVSIAGLLRLYEKFNVLQMPYLYRNEDHMWKVLEGEIGEQLLREINSVKLIGLCYYDGGSRSFYNNKKPIKSTADLKGLRIRVMDTPVSKRMVELLGGTVTLMPFGEVYQALKKGYIDCAENNWTSYVATSHYQVAKYFTVDEHFRIPEIIIMNLDAWNKLSKDEQDIIKKSANESTILQKKLWKEKEKESENKVRDEGCIIIVIKDNSDFQKAVQPMYEELSQEQKDLVKKIRAVK